MKRFKRLPFIVYKLVFYYSPVIAIDLIILDQYNNILLGKRMKKPAQGFYYVPGGRLRKLENIDFAILRILKIETNIENFIHYYFLHHYEQFFSSKIKRHYITLTHVVRIDPSKNNIRPDSQHDELKWFNLFQIEDSPMVHKNIIDYVHEYTKNK